MLVLIILSNTHNESVDYLEHNIDFDQFDLTENTNKGGAFIRQYRWKALVGFGMRMLNNGHVMVQ